MTGNSEVIRVRERLPTTHQQIAASVVSDERPRWSHVAYRLKGEVTPVIDPDRGYMSRRAPNRLYQECDKTRGHERSCPDQVEVEPRLTEKCEAELSIDHPSDQPRDCKIGNRVDAGGEHPG